MCGVNDCLLLLLLGIKLGLDVQGAGGHKIHWEVGYTNIQPLNLNILVVVMLWNDVAVLWYAVVLWDDVHYYFDRLGNTGLKFIELN